MKFNEAEFTDFANHNVYWWGQTEKADVNDVLATILAKHSHIIEAEVRKKFGFTDADFINALKNAQPGIFATKDKWKQVTSRFGLNIPFPHTSQRDLFIQRNKNKPNFQELLKKLDNSIAELISLVQSEKEETTMFDFEGFERREMALQANGKRYAQNILAQVKAKNDEDYTKLAKLKLESKDIWAEKQAIYAGNIEAQKLAAERWLGKNG